MKLSELHVDLDHQPRGRLDDATVEEYAEAMARGDKFPPMLAYQVTDRMFPGPVLVAGYHRFHAYGRAGVKAAEVEVRTGTYAEAWLAGWASNLTHGLRYTNAEKRRAVGMVLELHPTWSDRRIATAAGVGNKFVGDVRKELCSEHSSPRVGADGKTRSVPPAPSAASVKSPPAWDLERMMRTDQAFANSIMKALKTFEGEPMSPQERETLADNLVSFAEYFFHRAEKYRELEATGQSCPETA